MVFFGVYFFFGVCGYWGNLDFRVSLWFSNELIGSLYRFLRCVLMSLINVFDFYWGELLFRFGFYFRRS